MSELNRHRLHQALRWCEDHTLYERILTRIPKQMREPRRAKLSKEDTEILCALQKVKHEEDLICFCNIFTVPELAKHRRRLIVEPILNDYICKSDLAGIKLPTTEKLRSMAVRKYFIQFDAAAFFDQFPLTQQVARYFGIPMTLHQQSRQPGDTYRVLPMGFMPSCDVAQITAEVLTDFVKDGVECVCYIDNFFFAGDSKTAVDAAGAEFLRRCRACGVVINLPDGSMPTPNNPPTVTYTDSADVLGEHYDFTAQTRCATSSTMAKLKLACEVIATQQQDLVSRRQIAAVFGLLFFATRVLDVSPAPFYFAMRFYREMASSTGLDEWDEVAPRLPSKALGEVQLWLQRIALNIPVKILEVRKTSMYIFTDASVWGYGGVIITPEGVSTTSVPWTNLDRCTFQLQFSAVAHLNRWKFSRTTKDLCGRGKRVMAKVSCTTNYWPAWQPRILQCPRSSTSSQARRTRLTRIVEVES